MQVILLENINKLGKIGDQVEVKNGYARNYLLKKNKALRANKENIDFYIGKGIILEEPVEDIHSIIKYASVTLTTGDTLARESCLLGTPSIYAGKRDMPINKELISMGLMKKIDNFDDILPTINKIIDSKLKSKFKRKVKNNLENYWQNTTELIVNEILDSLKKIK